MSWSEDEVRAVARAYRLRYELSQRDRTQRARADELDWALERMDREADAGTLPIEVVDAMLHDPEADEEYPWYVAAGPIEDLLSEHAGRYAGTIAERCRVDPAWAQAATGVWLDRAAWESLPEALWRLVPGPVRDTGPVVPKHPNKPSKRQGKRSRHP